MKDNDIRKRIEQLRKDIEQASGEKPTFGTSPDCPPEVEEVFLRQVLDCELRDCEPKEKNRRARRG